MRKEIISTPLLKCFCVCVYNKNFNRQLNFRNITGSPVEYKTTYCWLQSQFSHILLACNPLEKLSRVPSYSVSSYIDPRGVWPIWCERRNSESCGPYVLTSKNQHVSKTLYKKCNELFHSNVTSTDQQCDLF